MAKQYLQPIRGRLSAYLILLAIAAIAMILLRECSLPHKSVDRDRRADGDTINVAIEYSPMSLYRYADTLGGLNYDIIRMIAAQKGWQLKFHPLTTLSQGIDGLKTGVYDIVVADMARTTDMDNAVIFTEPTFLDKQVLVQRRDSTGFPLIKSQLELGGDTVWTPADSPAIERLNNLSGEIGDSIHIMSSEAYGAEQLVMLTALGQIDLSVVNESTAKRLLEQYPELDTSLGISFTQFQSWILSPEKKMLADSVSVAIKEFKSTPAYSSLLSRYKL